MQRHLERTNQGEVGCRSCEVQLVPDARALPSTVSPQVTSDTAVPLISALAGLWKAEIGFILGGKLQWLVAIIERRDASAEQLAGPPATG